MYAKLARRMAFNHRTQREPFHHSAFLPYHGTKARARWTFKSSRSGGVHAPLTNEQKMRRAKQRITRILKRKGEALNLIDAAIARMEQG